MQLSRLASILRKTIGGIGDDALLTRAAAIAFYSALSFAPLIVLLLWLLAALRPESTAGPSNRACRPGSAGSPG